MHDCKTCINLDTWMCYTCLNNNDLDLGDHYERATPELVAEREAEERKRIEEPLCQEVMQLKLDPAFIETFNKCKRFTSNNMPKYVPVEARERSLVSTNAYALCELYCDVPEELKGKNIVKIEGESVYLAVRVPNVVPDKELKILPDDIDEFFQHKNSITNPDLSKIAKTITIEDDKYVDINVLNQKVTISADFLNAALDILGKDIATLGFTGECGNVVLMTPLGRIAISPVVNSPPSR